jgi:hypothetical protein
MNGMQGHKQMVNHINEKVSDRSQGCMSKGCMPGCGQLRGRLAVQFLLPDPYNKATLQPCF